MKKQRLALVGASIRSAAFVRALLRNYSDNHEIVGVFDIDPAKNRGFQEYAGITVPAFDDFDLMCDQLHPDRLLITTVDAFHEKYVVAGLDRGIGVVSEKPLCIDAAQCRKILAAHRRNPDVFAAVTHNARYMPVTVTLKELLDRRIIGRILGMEYRELLDHHHGASYFRRWNSRRRFSNGLQLHKCSHHFDKMNYLLASHAIEVTASGGLSAYGAAAPHEFSGERCSGCDHRERCPHSVYFDRPDGTNPNYLGFFKYRIDPAAYTPDQCIFSPEIDIEDHFTAGIKFANGVYCSYSLCAFSSYEGEYITLEGELGRLETKSVYYRSKDDHGQVHDDQVVREESIRLFRFGSLEAEDIPVRIFSGGHGGADPKIFAQLFGSDAEHRELPTLEEGIQAVLTGAAVVEAMQTGRKIAVQELLEQRS